MGLLEWECTVCLCPMKSSCKLSVSYPLCKHNENEILKQDKFDEFIFPDEGLFERNM